MPTRDSNTAGSSGGRRRKPQPTTKNNLAAGLVTGAVLAAVVGGGAVAFSVAGQNGKGAGSEVMQLDTAGAGGKSHEGLVDQVPVGNGSSGAATGGIDTGGLSIPDSLIPEGFGQGLDATGRPVPGSPQTPTVPGKSGAPSTPTLPSVPVVPGLTCPDHVATATVKVSTIYPGGGAANTVPLADGTVRATRVAAGPCAEKVVDLAVSDGTASGQLEYGAWMLRVEGRDPATAWPAVAVTSSKAVASAVDLAGTCSSGKTAVNLTVSVRTVVLVPLVTPMALGTVQATPTGSGPCKPAAVSIPLDLLGTGKASLAPGSWTFSVNGKSVYSGAATLAAADSGGSKSVALVVQ